MRSSRGRRARARPQPRLRKLWRAVAYQVVHDFDSWCWRCSCSKYQVASSAESHRCFQQQAPSPPSWEPSVQHLLPTSFCYTWTKVTAIKGSGDQSGLSSLLAATVISSRSHKWILVQFRLKDKDVGQGQWGRSQKDLEEAWRHHHG